MVMAIIHKWLHTALLEDRDVVLGAAYIAFVNVYKLKDLTLRMHIHALAYRALMCLNLSAAASGQV